MLVIVAMMVFALCLIGIAMSWDDDLPPTIWIEDETYQGGGYYLVTDQAGVKEWEKSRDNKEAGTEAE